MNNRLYLHLMANKEKGFALPLAVLIGLILMVTGITMIMRAQGDQSKVIAQKVRADALRSSEVGVARVQDLLNSVRVMARFNSDSNCDTRSCWKNAEVVTNPSNDLQKDLKKLVDAAACSNPEAAATLPEKIAELRGLASSNWVKLDNNRYYRVVRYDYNPVTSRGVLTLEGRSRTSAATDLTKTDRNIDSDDNAASRNRVVVTIPILNAPTPAFNRTTVPALWISEGNADDGAKFEGDVVEEVESPECNINQGKIQKPSTVTSPPYTAQFVGVRFPKLPPTPEGIPDLGKLTSPLLPAQKIFPRDTDSDRQVYEYSVDSINLKDEDKITITPGKRVVFYVKGDIKGAIEHNCGDKGCSGNLQIYAYNESGSICLTGNQTLQAFIFAPNYSLGKTGTGFTGAAWGKDWGKISGCPSTSGAVAVTQGVQWADLIADLRPPFPQLGGIDNWCEEPIDTAPGKSECN
ncbi:MAG: hypothetical protein IM550_14075 [Microcystis sp. M54BS1]|uniref:DUF7305 domain-containing protein n=1 Tax=unclassified Microcystis TaxID=2643300 RepID=UPI00257CB840|nr:MULTISPECIES: hypothetical protein [unclassified Microcystis]MCA2540299.1 hypothetical protein [Microcystis sp. M54BS1]MCA2596509.1 hypothetical protein [Microcystis sp. M38BS1]MCA2611533.1 hypothetical protein [Microcystis sp. M27BS1]MCA2504070.1 hypothetical protein [Microcystis sp. M62BS1]MCA2511870.1 hypothetical protein [Microcystis sp. M60BS1]